MSDLPTCCTPSHHASLAEVLYCANTAGGDPSTAGLNYQGLPCPRWVDLPDNIRAKWEATAREAHRLLCPVPSPRPLHEHLREAAAEPWPRVAFVISALADGHDIDNIHHIVTVAFKGDV